MPYSLRTYDGTSLVTIADGSVDDQATSSLFLIGKNVTGYGTRQNENFLYLLEHFAGLTPPSPALTGQIWFDKNTTVSKPKVFDGANWRTVGIAEVSDTEPTISKQGDLWWDTANNQLWAKTTSTYSLVGPEVTTGFGVTKLVSKSTHDINSGTHAVINVTVNDDIIAVWSQDAFAVGGNEAEYAAGFPNVVRGLTLKDGTSISGLDVANRANTETIDAQWNFASGISLGTDNSVTFDSNGNLVLNSNGSIIVNSNTMLPASVNTTLGSATQPFNYLYTSNVSSGSAIKQLKVLGDITVMTDSKIRPYLDNNVALGTTTSKWKNFYTYNISAGTPTSIGNIEGDWQLGTGSKLTTRWLKTPFITSGSAPTDGLIEGQWKLGTGSTWQATALIDADGNVFLPDQDPTLNTIAKRTGAGELKATRFIGPVTGDITGNVLGNTNGTHTGPVVGSVTGNVTGNVVGNSSGTHTGNVIGNVTGNLSGNVSGNISGNTIGTHTGPVIGNVTGNLSGNTSGTHTGPVTGNVIGDVSGTTRGTHVGLVLGNVTGNVTGDLSGNVNASVAVITSLAAGSVSASALYPGSGSGGGVRFPNDPGGGSGDSAWISYYPISGEKTVLEIGVTNDASGSTQDSLYLNASGGVGVKTTTPRYALDVNGDIGCNNVHGRADDSILWNGANKFISTSAPTNDQGADGDFWFQREA